MAVRFDAATDRISVAATLPDPATAITIAGWAYVSANTGTNATMCRVHASSGGSTTITFATAGAAPAGPGYFTAGGSVTSSTQFPVGAWRKVAVTCTGTAGNLYVATDGGATDNDSGTVGGAASPTGLTLGGRSAGDGSEWFNGRLAYWRVWSAVLSQAEIETEWASATPVRTSNLWAAWPLETHTDLTDHSGNGRHLSAGSTATTTEGGPPIAAPINGSGSVTAPASVVSGVGAVTVSGSGAVIAGAAAVDGTAAVLVTGSGAGTVPAATLSGAGTVVATGQGSVVVLDAALSGTGQVVITGSGSVAAPAAVVAGGNEAPVMAPPGTTAVVPAENRVAVVPAENRVVTV